MYSALSVRPVNEMKKKKEKVIVPLFTTHPIAKAEEGSKKNLEDAVKMAKKWVEENKL